LASGNFQTGGIRKSKSFDTKTRAVGWTTMAEAEIMAGKYGHIPDKSFGQLLPKAMRLLGKMRRWDSVSVFNLKRATPDALFRKYRARAGLSGFTFHDSRHNGGDMDFRTDAIDRYPCATGRFRPVQNVWMVERGQALTYYNPSASAIARRIRRRCWTSSRRSSSGISGLHIRRVISNRIARVDKRVLSIGHRQDRHLGIS
jgi:hypothetical protein